MKIRHLKHNEIDYKLWDKVISNSLNEMIYAQSWFLDNVSPNWEALISEDFDYVMPIPVKKKYLFKYAIQPILTQQLGIFSSKPITEKIVKEFIKSIPYCSYELNLNEKNHIKNSKILPNLLLNLSVSYERLLEKFSVNTQRNIKKAEKYNLQIDWNLSPQDFLHFFFKEEKTYNLPDINKTKTLVINALERNLVSLQGVRTLEGKLISSIGLFISGNRIIYLLPSSNTEGRKKSAMFFLVNEIIKKYANTDKFLDFEGSRIKGVARFYEGFGAKPVSYFLIKRFRPKFLIRK